MRANERRPEQIAVRIAILFLLLLLIGLVTRMPALAFPQFYALHGVLAAPFCAALAQWHFQHNGGVGELAAATGILALVLGVMSPVMGFGFGAVAVLALLVGLLAKVRSSASRRLAVSLVYGALQYPCALVCGVLFGSYFPSAESAVTITILLGLSCALSLLGALIPSYSYSKKASNAQPL